MGKNGYRVRTNYFKIKPGKEKVFEKIGKYLKKPVKIEIKEKDGLKYGFIGSNKDISYYPPGGNGDNEVEYFYSMLKSIVADDDAIIFCESKNDDPTNSMSNACIITKTTVKNVDPYAEVSSLVQGLLKNPLWETEYFLDAARDS